MTQNISNPIKKLLKAIRQVKGGDFTTRINIENRDEIGEIGREFNQMVDNIDSLLKENYIVKLKEQEAQISSLQAQINPHFLYNTLDTISWKAMLAGQDDICRMISCLGEILRYGISRPNEIVTVQEDFTQMVNYLHIQKCRYEERFAVRVDIAPETANLKIHKLMVQPLVENAITHGLEEKEEGGLLCVESFLREGMLVIKVYDNGCGIDNETIGRILNGEYELKKDAGKHSNIGIHNVRKRMKLYYGEQYGLEILSEAGEYTEVYLKFPIIV